MCRLCLFGAILVAFFGIVFSNDFFIITPRVVRLDCNETVGIVCGSANCKDAEVVVREYPGLTRHITRVTATFDGGYWLRMKIYLESSLFPPDFFRYPGFPKLVSLSVSIDNSVKNITIPISYQHGYVFIQTDKPIYTPDQEVRMRIISLNEEGLPTEEDIKLQIKNPDGVIVREESLRTKTKKFLRSTYRFARYPVTGKWSVIALFGFNFNQNHSVQFRLKEYVLPPLIVDVEIKPEVVLPSTDHINVRVKAKYSYKDDEKVEGHVLLTISLVTGEKSVSERYDSTMKLVLGHANYQIRTENILERLGYDSFPWVDEVRLTAEATVVEKASGITSKGLNSTIFCRSPYVLSFKRSFNYFYPGLYTVFEVDVKTCRHRPACHVTVIGSFETDGRIANCSNCEHKTDEYGRVSFEFAIKDCHSIKLTARTSDRNYPDESQAVGVHQQERIELKDEEYLALTRLTATSTVMVGSTFTTYFYFSFKEDKSIYYMVVARGKIVFLQKAERNPQENRISFDVTERMVPDFRLVLFANLDSRLLVDSLKIEVKRECPEDAKVTVKPSYTTIEPGGSIKLKISGMKDTCVGIVAVDETVYELEESNFFNQEKIFDAFANHDIGCGAGCGRDLKQILRDAGIAITTKDFSSPPSYYCSQNDPQGNSSVTMLDPENEYQGDDLLCCQRGKTKDKFERNCGSRVKQLELWKDLSADCRKAFEKCCRYQFEVRIGPHSISLPGDGEADAVNEVDYGDKRLRRHFSETFFFEDICIGAGEDKEPNAVVPDSITSWRLQHFSVSPEHGMCVGKEQKLTVTKNVFLKVHLPYAVVLNEQLEIPVTVYNFNEEKLQAIVYMMSEEDLCTKFILERYGWKRVEVEAKAASSVFFSAKPLRVKKRLFKLHFILTTAEGQYQDIVERDLNVIFPGVEESKEVTIMLDPADEQRGTAIKREERYVDQVVARDNLQITVLNLTLPEDYIPGTEAASIVITGNPMGAVVETALNDPGSLIKLPKGCGEQNMIFMAPTLYTVRYLKAVEKLTPDLEEKGYTFMRSGYDNMMNFKKNDSSYAAFKNRPSSMWLTAFVLKIFCQARKLIFIDPQVIKNGLNWLRHNQGADGSFNETNLVYHRKIMGGVKGKISMTAFALIALEECAQEGERLLTARDRAVKFLEKNFLTLTSPLEIAVTSYAMTLADSYMKLSAARKLISLAKFDANQNSMHWETSNSAQDVETAGYALLNLMLLNDMGSSSLVINFLNTQQLQSGSFKSTQDTVIALQALSEYAIRAGRPALSLTCKVVSAMYGSHLNKTVVINERNAGIPQHIDIKNVKGLVYVHTKGHGVGKLSLSLQYKTNKLPENCKFDIESEAEEVEKEPVVIETSKDSDEEDSNSTESEEEKPILREHYVKLKIRTRRLTDETDGMCAIEVRMPSGYVPEDSSLERAKNMRRGGPQKYEIQEGVVYFYFKKISKSWTKIEFIIKRAYNVSDLKKSVIRVYDYYSWNESCTKYYSIQNGASDIQTLCENDQCICFEVWRGTVTDKKNEDEKLEISFSIQKVIKNGAETSDHLLDNVRKLWSPSPDGCAERFETGTQYLIMGKDGFLPQKHGLGNHRYIINGASVVYKWLKTGDAVLDRDLKNVTKNLENNEGCG